MAIERESKKYEYWTDKVANYIEEKVANNPILEKVVEKNGYIVYDEKTPSGKIHIGSARGWVIHDIIAKTMREHKMKARFILSSDDMDPFDAIPADLDKAKYSKFMGVPMRNVPSPVIGYKSFADYYFTQVTNKFKEFGIEAELESTGERYIKGDFNSTIKIALDNSDKIQKIYQRIYGKSIGTDKLPFNPICEKCGSIGTTVAYEWDKEKEIVKYECKENFVKWAKGCGHKGEVSPYNGNGKLPWKVEWAAKWPTVGVVCETGGKDHFSEGGSRTVAVAIATEIFNYPPPWPSTPENIGQGYEFFLVEGKKMSTSKGIGTSFVEIAELVPPKILRFLMVRTRPETTIDFKEENIPMIYEDFERHERIYFGLEKVEKREEVNARRVYELSCIGGIPKIESKEDLRKSYVPFETLKNLIKITPDNNGGEFLIKKLKEMNYSTSSFALKRINEKIAFVKYWMENFEKTETRQLEIDPRIKTTITDLIEAIKSSENETDLNNKIFEVAKKDNVKPGELFKSVYMIILNSERGPRLASYIFEVGKEQIIKKLKESAE